MANVFFSNRCLHALDHFIVYMLHLPRCSTLCAPNLPKMRLCLTSQLLSCWSSRPVSIQETVGQPSLISFAKPLRNPIISGLYSRKEYYIMLPSRWVTNAAICWKVGNGNPQEIIIIGPCLNEHLFQMLSKKKKKGTSWILNTISQRIHCHTQHFRLFTERKLQFFSSRRWQVLRRTTWSMN